MPAHIRALLVVLVVAGAVLWMARGVACERAIAPEDYKRRSAVWLGLTVLAFTTHFYWLYALITVPVMYFTARKDSSTLGFLFFVLYAIPPFPADIPSIGGLGNILTVDHLRWLAIAVLLPAFLALRRTRGTPGFPSLTVDKAILAYMLLWFVLQALETTVTNLIRITLALFLDLFLPYYVASRALKDVRGYRDVLMSLVVAALLLASTATFEFLRSWLLYNGLEQILGLPYWGFGNYTEREGGFTRAISTAGHPISLGYLIIVGMAMLVFVGPMVSSVRMRRLAWAALGVGLIASMSRGPWVGGAAMLLVLLVTGPDVGKKLGRAAAASAVLLPLAMMTKQGQAMIDYLPWIGTAGSQTVDFRERLFDVSVQVLMHFPVFGSLTFLDHPLMQQMRGGDGIIDMVNSYLGVALATGFVGLTLFVAPFLLVIAGIIRSLRGIRDLDSDAHRLGRSLLAALVGIMVTIGTTSSVTAIPVTYYLVIGLSAAYCRLMLQGTAVPLEVPQTARPRPMPGRPYPARQRH